MNKINRCALTALFLGIFMSCEILPDGFTGASKSMVMNGNSLFHQTEETSLKVGEIKVLGEVEKTGNVDLNNHYKREVIVKESTYTPESGTIFHGAFRYRGYSLFDLLHPFKLEKKNADIFRPAIDVYVVIENASGETVSFSWSEIFHTNNPHQIIIATEVAPIVPYRREVDYPTGDNWKVIAANDLFAFRVLEDPTTITVYSFDKKDYTITRNMEPMYSGKISIIMNETQIGTIEPDYNTEIYTKYYSSFYGMGMGHHASENFSGPKLPEKLDGLIHPFDNSLIRNGLVCFAGIDGYRAVYSFSELFNRVDQVAPILAVPDNPNDGGFYRIFTPSEFYADRSVKSLKEILFFKH